MFVKQPFPLRPILFFLFSFPLFFSCKKVNEATLLGGDLVPEVDNINTFDTSFATATDNLLLSDTTKLLYTDAVALGTILSDPEFGQTNAAVYFQVAPTTFKTYPFKGPKDSVQIDSVVLSLDYISAYGDTGTPQTVRVYEIAQTAPFYDTAYYTFNQPHFETTGAELGSKTFTTKSLRDSIYLTHGDSVRVANELRITLSNGLGERFRDYDTTTSPLSGGYNSYALFEKLFRGLALKADEGSGNGLVYFDLSNTAKTRLTIYYRATKNGGEDTTETAFVHGIRVADSAVYSKGGQANCIIRQPAGGWADYLNNGTSEDDKLYIQSAPGSAGYIKIPALDAFENKLIHRAELIMTRIATPFQDWFTAPQQLFLDKIKTGNGSDSAFIFHEYLPFIDQSPGYRFDYASAGGHLRTDNTYRFNVTATVQDILARDSSNYQLRIYSPLETAPYDARFQPAVPRSIPVFPFPAYNRVVLAGGNYTDPERRAQLYVVYSDL